jgi:hypothetical protein
MAKADEGGGRARGRDGRFAGRRGAESRRLLEVPWTPEELVARVEGLIGARFARRALMDGSDAPLAYLVHSFFEGAWGLGPDGRFVRGGAALGPDCVVWAARGGGKTFLGAVATMLDLVYKPGVEVRVLGGSLEQSRRMHEHLRGFFERPVLAGLLDGRATDKKLRLTNGSRVEVLAQSESSVRGTRVQKLRCDEVDLFDRGVWEAAQLTTRSKALDGPWGASVRGSVHALSTMHVPMGLMWELVNGAAPLRVALAGTAAGGALDGGRVLLRWTVIDALETCDQREVCAACNLESDCGGLAKRPGTGELAAQAEPAGGHVSVEDARRLRSRVSLRVWNSEMMSRVPRAESSVFPEFDTRVHVRPAQTLASPRQVRLLCGGGVGRAMLVAGMDFGVRSPTVVLWALVTAPEGWPGEPAGAPGGAGDQREPEENAFAGWHVTVLGEYVERGRTLAQHVAAVQASAWGEPAWIGCDPAGHARNDQTGVSAIAALCRAGLAARALRSGLLSSLELVRGRLAPASGGPTLTISDACPRLIESLVRYRYDGAGVGGGVPLKDGADHCVDALRYMLVVLGQGRGQRRRYA